MAEIGAHNDAVIRLHRGSLYVDVSVYERYFRGLETVALLEVNEALYVMPIKNASAGGYLLKLRNRAGDRVIHAADFFRDHNIDDEQPIEFSVRWVQERAALLLDGAKSAN